MPTYDKTRGSNIKEPLREYTMTAVVEEKSFYKFYIRARSDAEAMAKMDEHDFDWDGARCEPESCTIDEVKIEHSYIPAQDIPYEPNRVHYMCYNCPNDKLTLSHKECPLCKTPITWKTTQGTPYVGK